MDVTHSLALKRWSLALSARPAIGSFLLAILLFGCSGSEPQPIVPLPPESFNELKEKIAQLRGSRFRRDVFLAKDYQDHGKITLERVASEEYGAPSIDRISLVYQRVGLLPQSADLANALLNFARLQRLYFYDAASESIMVAPESINLARALTPASTRRSDNIPAAFALTQALQEQHFRWHERLRAISLEDRKMTFRALAHGEAVLVGLIYLQGDPHPQKWAEQLAGVARLAAELEKMGAALPDMLLDKLVIPYREGSRFLQWAYAAKGWDGVNSLFVDPPLSTAQILHPEKFFLQRQEPLRIFPWWFIRQIDDRAAIDQTLGEGLIQTLLRSHYSRKEAQQIASGWRGDHLSASSEGEPPLTAWISAWSDEKKAREFFRAYETVLERRHRLRFASSPGRINSSQAEIAGGRAMLLQVRGPVVLLLDGMASARVLNSADEIWKDLEIETEPRTIPFDSAKGPPQSSRKSR